MKFLTAILLFFVLIGLISSTSAQMGGTQGSSSLVIANMGASGDKSPTDAGITSYITEYYNYLFNKYGHSIITTSFLSSPIGSFQAPSDGVNCGQSFFNLVNVAAAHSLGVTVLIIRPLGLDNGSCTAVQVEAALQNIYNEAVAAGMTVYMQTAPPISNPDSGGHAAIQQAITTYELAHFPHIIDMTTSFTNSDYTCNCTYFVGSDGTCGAIYNAAGNTLGAQRIEAALPY